MKDEHCWTPEGSVCIKFACVVMWRVRSWPPQITKSHWRMLWPRIQNSIDTSSRQARFCRPPRDVKRVVNQHA